MPRSNITVREATATDLAVLLALSDELRSDTPDARRRANGRPSPDGRLSEEERYAEALADPQRRFVLAVDDADQALGMALLSESSSSGLGDLTAVQMSHVVVPDRNRRRGAGRALVAAAAAYAEELGVDRVVVSVPPSARDANRFYARLGFAPVAIRRVAPVHLVRRRLAALEIPATEPSVRRRSLRAGARARLRSRADHPVVEPPRRRRSLPAPLPLGSDDVAPESATPA